MPENLREVYHSFNLDVERHKGNLDYELPMPATNILDTNCKIEYVFVSEDYTECANPKEIINTLTNKK